MKVGTDIVNIAKFGERLASARGKFEEDVFFEGEWEDGNAEHLAGVFAAKEAAIKAFDLAPGSWKRIEVKKLDSGKPTLIFHGLEIDGKNCDVSISHAADYAIAVVICNY